MAQLLIQEDVNGNKLPCPIRIHDDIHPNLQAINNYVKHDWDAVIIYFGKSGVGKSTLAKVHALVLDHRFSNANIFYTIEEFYEWINNAPKGSVGLWDEADILADDSNRERMNAIKRKLKHIRKRNLILLWCTPTIKDMNWYFIERCIAGVHVRSYGAADRGHYDLYANTDQDMRFTSLFEYMKKSPTQWKAFQAIKPSIPKVYSSHPKAYIEGYPNGNWPIDEELYEKKKDEADAIVEKENMTNKQAIRKFRQECVVRYFELTRKDYSAIAKAKPAGVVFDVAPSTVRADLEHQGVEIHG